MLSTHDSMPTLPVLGSLDSVRAIVVDRMRWWREQRRWRRPLCPQRRAHSAPEARSVSAVGPAALALRHPPQLVFAAVPGRRESVQRGAGEADGLTELTAAERDFYAAQLQRAVAGSGQRGRRRAASAPALSAVRLCLRPHRAADRRAMARVAQYIAQQQQQYQQQEQEPQQRVMGDGNRSTHACRRVGCLQDAYAFNPAADLIGDGAFSRVFRAVRLFGAKPIAAHDPFVAIKVIPRCKAQRLHPLGGERAYVLEHTHTHKHTHDRQMPLNQLGSATETLSIPTASAVSPTHRGEHLDRPRRELVEIGREISILRSVHHSGCAEFVEALRTPDEFVVVMKMRKKCLDARQFLELYGSPSETRVALIIYQLIETVHYLHQTHNIIHRDIKLENLLLSCADSSRERIRQVLGKETARAWRMRRDSSGDLRDRKHDHTNHKSDEDSEESKAATRRPLTYGATGNANDENLNERDSQLLSQWGSATRRHGPGDFESLLKVTLVDFGLARRTDRRVELRHQNNPAAVGTHNVSCESPATQRCSENAGGETSRGMTTQVGMPTPLPSTANFFVSAVEGENSASDVSQNDACASSTYVSASEMMTESDDRSTSRASEEEEEEEEDVDEEREQEQEEEQEEEADDNAVSRQQRTEGWADAFATDETAASASPVLSTVGATTPTHHPCHHQRCETNASTEDRNKRKEADGVAVSVNSSSSSWTARPFVSATESLAFPRLDNSSRDETACAMPAPASLPAPLPTSAFAHGPPQSPQATDDAEAMLFLTPCGTDKYLPPEILSWMVNCGCERKATTVRVARKLDSYAIGIVAYVLLSGCFPFNGTSRASMARQKKRCAPKCNSRRWYNISTDAVSFVQALLQPDLNERMDVGDALSHPWMRRASQLAKKLNLVPSPITEGPSLLQPSQPSQPSLESLSHSQTIQCAGGQVAQRVTPLQSVTSLGPRCHRDELIGSGSGAPQRQPIFSNGTQPQGAVSIFMQMAAAAKGGLELVETSARGDDDNDDDADGDNDPFTRIFNTVMSE